MISVMNISLPGRNPVPQVLSGGRPAAKASTFQTRLLGGLSSQENLAMGGVGPSPGLKWVPR